MEKHNSLISLLRQTFPLPAGCVCGPSTHLSTNLGHRKNPTSPRLKCQLLLHAHSQPWVAATLLGTLLLGSWQGRSSHVAQAPQFVLCLGVRGRSGMWRCLKGDSVLWLGLGAS